jgi:DNA-binding XRE family transcriptional regulator
MMSLEIVCGAPRRLPWPTTPGMRSLQACRFSTAAPWGARLTAEGDGATVKANVDYSQWRVLRAYLIALRMEIGALVGKNIVRIRNERNVTQEELAFRAKIDRSYLSQVESGKRNPSLRLLARIAESLDVKVARFLMDGD